ncbi:MAG: hypothetical protein WCH34_05250 [Bacteroidota bacterium]
MKTQRTLFLILMLIASFAHAQEIPKTNHQSPLEQIAFKAHLINPLSVNGNTDVAFDTVFFNNGNAYNKETGNFISPAAGLYYFHAQLIWYASEKPHTVGFRIAKNSNSADDVESWTEISQSMQGAAFTATSALMNLAVGDTVKVKANAAWGGNTTIGTYLGDSHFFGYKVY